MRAPHRNRWLLAALPLVVPEAAAWAQAGALSAHMQGRGELAGEYDSNPSRLEQVRGAPRPRIEGAAATRVQGNLSAVLPLGERLSLALSAGGAYRAFADELARRENMVIAQGGSALSLGLLPGTALALSLAYYDVFQARGFTARAFRSLAPALQAEQRVGAGVLSVGAGYRWFAFKPLPDFDFEATRLLAGYRLSSLADLERDPDGADWELQVQGSYEQRVFAGSRCVRDDTCPPAVRLGARKDDFAMLGAELTRTTDVLLGAGLAAQWNASNSFGETLVRLALHAKLGVPLPAQLLFTGRAELLLTRYAEPVPLARDEVTGLPRTSIEEESRSTLRAELSRTLGARTELFARYVFYSNELGRVPSRYQRHSAIIALAFSLDPAGGR